MSSRVEIPAPALVLIRGWGLDRRLLIEVLNRLHVDLGGNPGLLRHYVAPVRGDFFRFVLDDGAVRHFFWFRVEKVGSVAHLVVVDGGYSRTE